MISNLPITKRTAIVAARWLALVLVVLLAGTATGQDRGDGVKKIPRPRPQSHRADWIRNHGADVNLDPGGRGAPQSCSLCHEKADCISCHNTQLPKDHTNTWRIRTHGFQAEANRDRCATCHKEDYCIRCHNETTPRSHSGRWNAGGLVNTPDSPTHCKWCHFSSRITPAEGCGVCHKRAPHTSAPHTVNGAIDCNNCHL